jgi:hypothetical protein
LDAKEVYFFIHPFYTNRDNTFASVLLLIPVKELRNLDAKEVNGYFFIHSLYTNRETLHASVLLLIPVKELSILDV